MTYIERDALLEELNEYRSNLLRVYATITEEKDKRCYRSEIGGVVAVIKEVQQLPAAAVVPVPASTWEVAIGYDPRRTVQCQNCFKMAFEPSEYCPACGAQMEIGANDMSIIEISCRRRTKREQEAFDMGRELGKREAVKHGRWIKDDENPAVRAIGIKATAYQCDVCHGFVFGLRYNYCPNCGCKMDLED